MENTAKTKNKKQKMKLSELVLMTIVFLLFCSMIMLIVFSLVSIKNKQSNFFSQDIIKNCFYIIFTAIVLVITNWLVSKNKIIAGEWLKISLYSALFITINIFNIFNLYNILVLKIIGFAVIGSIFAVIGISIYYNYLKNQANQVKAKASMVVIFSIALSIAFAVVTEIIKYLLFLILSIPAISILSIILNIVYYLCGAIIINIGFYISLVKNKKFINWFLIDIN